MTKDEALKLAIETLENAQGNYGCYWTETITDLREALTQPEEQPVGFVVMERQPLTDFEVVEALMPVNVLGEGYYLRIARAIEAAHGIGKKT